MKRMLFTSMATLVAVASLSTLSATSASANDIPDTAVGDSVAVYGQITATGYSGWGWWTSRTTRTDSFHGSAPVPTPSDFVLLARPAICAGDYSVAGQAFVDHRRDDGWVLVSLLIWSWDECPSRGHHGAWQQRYAWVAPGESTTIDLSTRDSAGGFTASFTFTNYWTPKIDTSGIEPVISLSDGFGL